MITIGIVEDNRELREGLKKMVEETPGHQCVCVCSSAEDGLRDLPAARPEVVLMDINLPLLSGIECTRCLLELCPETKVLMLSVQEDSDNILNALKAGASGYLLKCSSSSEIIQAIADVREGGAPMTSQIARKVVAFFREKPKTPSLAEDLLSEREAEVLRYLSQGHEEVEIAEILHVSINTIKMHRKHIYKKLHVRSRKEILLRFPAAPQVPAT